MPENDERRPTRPPDGATSITATSLTDFQPMPPLEPGEYTALRDDIARHGIRVPVVRDQHGRILDGHNRVAIAAELGLDVPFETVTVVDDDEALDVAVTLNCARRHLGTAQKRTLIQSELKRRPDDSDRAIARRVGCDHKTVSRARRELHQGGEIPHPAPAGWQTPQDVNLEAKAAALRMFGQTNLPAELPATDEADDWCRHAIVQDVDNEFALACLLASGYAGTPELAAAIIGRMTLWKSRGIDRRRIKELFEPWLDMALSASFSAEHRARAPEAVRDFGQRADADPEFAESLLNLVASIPAMPERGEF